MNAQTRINAASADAAAAFEMFAAQSFQAMEPLCASMQDLDAILTQLSDVGDRSIEPKARRLRNKLAAFAPSVTMIGQVKAGKTSLVNAMAGCPGLLPADVNPWTSVVTTLHLSPRPVARETKAEFRFFEQNEWDRLVSSGGRVGEIAGRAGAENEVAKVHAQIAAMQEKSRRRLGRKFELLLGQSHDYGDFDTGLIERYVCLGDDFDTDTDVTRANGRFADITKSADLHMHRAGLPVALSIRDTPGVNDTFMVREQITIRAIRDSRICVMVLSAHQALSSVDMALIRLISNIDARDVVIFVNRIDELSDPATQVPEIRESILATLRDHQGPSGVEIVFGSALWANVALQAESVPLSKAAIAALKSWAAANKGKMPGLKDHRAIVWQLSGLPGLFDAIARRIVEGPGREVVDAVSTRTRNLARELEAANSLSGPNGPPRSAAGVDPETALAHLTRLQQETAPRLCSDLDRHYGDFEARLENAHNSFLHRATAGLVDHLQRYGEETAWSYDPTGLRVLLRSAYQLFAKRALASASSALTGAADEISQLYRGAGLVQDPGFAIAPPDLPHVPPPVMLGQTIALDLQGNWWSRWWRRRRGYDAFAEEFYHLIRAESAPIIEGLKSDHAKALLTEISACSAEFLEEQTAALARLLNQDNAEAAHAAAELGGASTETRQQVVAGALKSLQDLAA